MLVAFPASTFWFQFFIFSPFAYTYSSTNVLYLGNAFDYDFGFLSYRMTHFR